MIIILIMIIFQSTWPQLDISPCSYQSYSVIVLILLCLAVPFYNPRLFLFGISHIFDKAIKNCQKRILHFSQLDTVYNKHECMCVQYS